MLILEETCWNCQNKDYVPRKDKYGNSLPCPHCKAGTIITPEGQAILDFVERHLVTELDFVKRHLVTEAIEKHEGNYVHKSSQYDE